MPTPREGYKLADGTKVPGVTTVIGNCLGWNKGALMWWANQEGLAGRNHRDSSQAAADAGTLAHAMVEAHIHGVPFVAPIGTDPAQLAKASVAFGAYREWESDTRLQIVATEIKLVSEVHRFGATPDAIAIRANKGLVLPDWKSSKGTYADHLLQLAAYGHAFEEVTGMELVGGYYLCRFDKMSGGFSTKWWPRDALDGAWKAFLACRQLYELQKDCEALAK
jgi:hypothetical protein